MVENVENKKNKKKWNIVILNPIKSATPIHSNFFPFKSTAKSVG